LRGGITTVFQWRPEGVFPPEYTEVEELVVGENTIRTGSGAFFLSWCCSSIRR